ncbi:MAG: hypothetical protein V4568_13275 [Pseudomonadota bacterium]
MLWSLPCRADWLTHIDQIAIAINGSIQVTPLTINFKQAASSRWLLPTFPRQHRRSYCAISGTTNASILARLFIMRDPRITRTA